MKYPVAMWIASILLIFAPPEPGIAQPTTPVEVDKEERERVRLVLVDVVALDKQDRTVADLTVDDFEVVVRGRRVPIDTLDVSCSEGASDEPRAVRHASQRPPITAPEGGRRIVLAVDYLHTNMQQRVDVLEQAREMVEHGAEESDEFMVAALTGGLRIEQMFTSDREATMRTLRRMEYDISLWNGTFTHVNEIGFVAGLTTLMDVLGTVPGNKAIVLYSAMDDVPLDLQFQEIAAVAATSRCAIYPVDAWGLRTPQEERLGGG